LTDFPRQVDVLVAGAGPAGSATAALLARAGCSVLAADRASFPRDKACSEYMSPEAVRILTRLGVTDELEDAGAVALEGLKVTASRGARAHGRFAGGYPAPFRPTGLSISRRILDHQLVLAARAAGVMLAERAFVEELLYDRAAVNGAVLRDEQGKRHPVRARLTVGADGLRSVVARRIGHRHHGKPKRVAFVGHMAGVREMGLSAELHFSQSGYVGFNPIGGGCTNVGVVVPAALAASARGRVEQFFYEVLSEYPELHRRVADSRLLRPVLATGPFAAWSGRVTAPGVLLVGDAADFFDPVTGDGIYSALRGAELLAASMVPALTDSAISLADGLREYRRTRRQAFAGKWILERLLGWAMRFPRLFDRGVGRMGRRDGMADTMVGAAGGYIPCGEVLNPRFLARMLV
jgi:menaquinone-9 beta-reductase